MKTLQPARSRRRAAGGRDRRVARQGGRRGRADQPLVSVETAKAIVEIPSPRSGRDQAAARQARRHPRTSASRWSSSTTATTRRPMPARSSVGRSRRRPRPTRGGARRPRPARRRVKATPAVRALAQRLDVDLAIVTPSGPDGTITATDVERVARILARSGRSSCCAACAARWRAAWRRRTPRSRPVTVCDDADIARVGPAET